MPRSFARRTSPEVPWYHRNQHKRWTAREMDALRRLAGEHTSARVIGLRLGRSAESVLRMASRQGIALGAMRRSLHAQLIALEPQPVRNA